MKKINLLFSTLVLVFALLVLSASTVAPIMQAQALSLKTASNSNNKLSGKVLFDENGYYAVDLDTLTRGLTTEGEPHTYQFFGHDWRLVWVNKEQKVATFWMADPYAATSFNQNYRSGFGIYNDGDNIWSNGYTKTTWKSDATQSKPNGVITLAQSDIRKFLYEDAKTMLDNNDYAKYAKKVKAGFVTGSNQTNETAKKNITYLAFSKTSVDNVTRHKVNSNEELTADYGLDASDRLWLPSINDLLIWGVLGKKTVTVKDSSNNDVQKEIIQVTKPRTLGWTDTTCSSAAWLRDANPDYSEYARVITGAEIKLSNEETSASYFHSLPVAQTAGVRPAIHLDIASINEEYEKHVNNQVSGNAWWDDNWLKVLFMVICIVGLVGLILVVIGVVVKVRRARKNHEL